MAKDSKISVRLSKAPLLHHLQPLDELPAEHIVHRRLVVTHRTFEKMIRRSSSADPTTPALRELMRNGDQPVRKPKR